MSSSHTGIKGCVLQQHPSVWGQEAASEGALAARISNLHTAYLVKLQALLQRWESGELLEMHIPGPSLDLRNWVGLASGG